MKLDRKNKILVFGFMATLYLCYAFAFSNTFIYYNEYQKQKELAESNLSDPALLEKLLQRERQLDTYLIRYSTAAGKTFQNELLKNLSVLSRKNKLKIVDFREPHAFAENGVKTTSYLFSLQGSFNGILLLMNSVENNPSLGIVKHISFIKKKDYKTNTDYLTAEIVLQKNESAPMD